MRQIPILVAIAMASLSSAGAYWNPDPAVNVPISLADGEKYDVFAVSDGVGGALLVWEDKRSGDSDIYMQRLNVRGETLWQVAGVPVCTAPNDQFLYHSATGPGMEDQPTLCPDGDGGIFAVWQDKNSDPIFYDLWGQHVSATGELLWSGGAPLPLVEVAWDQDAPTLCPDGQGGFFMAWTDSRTHLNDIYAQRIDADGQPLWAANGVPVYEHTEGQDAVVIELAADGNPDPRLDVTIFHENSTELFVGKDYDWWLLRMRNPDEIYTSYFKYSEQEFIEGSATEFDGGTDFIFIRYADVLLLYAECLIQNGKVSDAQTQINKVRARSNMSDLAVGDVDMEQLQHERVVELSGELVRFFDQKRWGIYNSGDSIRDPNFATFKEGRSEVQPIPQSELDLNSNLIQNPGY